LEDGEEVFVEAGKTCRCGWLAVWGEAEEGAVDQIKELMDRLEFTTLAEACRIASERSGRPVASSTVSQACREGRIPALAVGRTWLVRPQAIMGRLGLYGKRGRPPISLFERARARVNGSEDLLEYGDVILYDWAEGDEHWEWVLSADEGEILEWARRVDAESV